VDLLRFPIVGGVLRWRHLRLTLQLVVAALAAVVVLHGLLGPQIAPRNLATVLTAIHWRGLLIVALIAIGNLFCTSCPMILARDAGRRVFHAGLPWPRRLRGKWVALALLVLVLFSYELFDLWERPRATALLVLGYFVLALAVDLIFRGAAFCNHVCPIGQFNFVASTLASTELQVSDPATCRSCHTFDCIKGRRSAAEPLRIVRRGCELGLFLPAKVGNLDCTLCLDCVRACPHDNIALTPRLPGIELLDTRRRSGIGRVARRADITALAVVFTFGALLNAFVMTAPSATAERWLVETFGFASEAPALALLFVVGLGAIPVLLLSAAAALTRSTSRDEAGSLATTASRYALALLPLACGVWLAHYGFHLLTGALTIVPVVQSAAIDLFGRAALGEPLWHWVGMQPGSVFPLQLGVVMLGAAGSLGLVYGTSVRDYPVRPAAASAPWTALVVVLAAAAVWIMSQPMAMRGVGAIG
jgi:polyferredoxin